LVLIDSGAHLAPPNGGPTFFFRPMDFDLSVDSIETSGAFEVEVTCQKTPGFEIEADDNILPLVQTEVSGGVLRITTTKSYSSNGGIKVRINAPDLASVKSTGAGKFNISGLKNDNFEIRSTGAATVVASGQSKSVKINSTGAGKIDKLKLRNLRD